MLSTLLAILGSSVVAAGVTGLASYFINKKTNETNVKNIQATNQANQEINQNNLDYNTAMTQAQWERDDNAHQREVADLEAAGLSPLASTSGAMNSQALGAPNPIAMQAPQIDSNALINSLLGSAQLAETSRHNKQIERQRDSEIELEAKRVSQRAEELNIENKKVEEQIRYQTRINELESQRIDEIIRSNKKSEELRLSEIEQKHLEMETKRYYEEIKHQAGGENVPYKVFDDFEIYCTYKKLYTIKLERFINEISATSKSSASSASQSVGASAGVGIVGSPIGGFNASGNGSESKSIYSSENWSDKQKAMWYKFQQDNPVPIFMAK